VDDDNSLSNQQLASRLRRVFHKDISPRRISDYLAGADPPFVRLTPSRTDPDVLTDETLRQRAVVSRRRRDVPWERQLYADEKFFYVQRPPSYVRSRRGQRQFQIAPYAAKRYLFFCALSLHGWFAARLVDATLNDQTFRDWAMADLVPDIRRNDVLYLDQLGRGRARVPSTMHYNTEVIRAIHRARAAVEHTPRKSPQANPIELLFNFLETRVRRAMPDSFDALWTVVRRALNDVTPEMIEGWYRKRATDADMREQEESLGL